MDKDKNPFEGSYEQPWDRDNIQWRRAKAMYASWGIKIEEKEDNIVLVTQTKLYNGHRIFNQKELVHRGRTLYPDKRYKVTPVTYTLSISDITPEWIQEQMRLYGVKPKDFARQLALTNSTISLAINGTRPVAPYTKALFYYYFMAKRLSREMVGLSDEEVTQAFTEALAKLKERKAEQAF